MSDLGWWVIHSEEILEMLNRVQNGESADLVFAELWANGVIDVQSTTKENNAS